MNPWPFIIAAYGLTGACTLLVAVQAYLAMRRAEKKVEEL